MPQTLVTVDEYRTITQDYMTLATVVSARLEESVKLIDGYLQRHLENGVYTENLEVWYGGYAYPSNTPLTALPPDVSHVIDYGDTRLHSVVANTDPFFWPVYTGVAYDGPSPYATITYTGGYTNETLPYLLKEYISLVAKALIYRTVSTPVGATSLRVGDVSVTYPKPGSGLDSLVPGITFGLKAFKRKRVRS